MIIFKKEIFLIKFLFLKDVLNINKNQVMSKIKYMNQINLKLRFREYHLNN